MKLINDHPLSIKENGEAVLHESHVVDVLKKVDRVRTKIPWRHYEKLICYCRNCRKGFTILNYFEDEKLRDAHKALQR